MLATCKKHVVTVIVIDPSVHNLSQRHIAFEFSFRGKKNLKKRTITSFIGLIAVENRNVETADIQRLLPTQNVNISGPTGSITGNHRSAFNRFMNVPLRLKPAPWRSPVESLTSVRSFFSFCLCRSCTWGGHGTPAEGFTLSTGVCVEVCSDTAEQKKTAR